METDKYNVSALLASKFIKIAKELIDWCIDRIMDNKMIEQEEQKKIKDLLFPFMQEIKTAPSAEIKKKLDVFQNINPEIPKSLINLSACSRASKLESLAAQNPTTKKGFFKALDCSIRNNIGKANYNAIKEINKTQQQQQQQDQEILDLKKQKKNAKIYNKRKKLNINSKSKKGAK